MKLVKKLVYLNIILALVLNWFTTNPSIVIFGLSYLGLIPKQSIAIIELLSVIILIITLSKLSKKKIVVFPLLIISAFLVIYPPYVKLFGGGIFNFVMGARNYLSFVPIYVAGLYFSYHNYSIKPYLILILILALVQLPVTSFQYLFSFSLLSRSTPYDVVAGTMGGLAGNLMAVILTCVSVVVFSFYLQERRHWYLLVMLALLLPCILAEAKGVFPLLTLGLGYLFLNGNLSPSTKIITLIYGFLFILSAGFAYDALVDRDRDVLDPTYYFQYEANKDVKDTRLSRFESITYAFQTIGENPASLIFGVGPGNASLNSFVGNNGPYYSFILSFIFGID